MKRCPRCTRDLDESSFGRNRSRRDGLSFYCLSCNRARNNHWYRDHRRAAGHDIRDHSWVPEGFRWCPSCQQAVAHDAYTRNRTTASGFGSRCRACANAANSAGYFYRKYKLTPDQVARLRAAQDDRCAICGEHGPGHLDHDHATGRVRALLCFNCNGGLGQFRDDPEVLRAAADYVRHHTISHQALTALAARGIGPVRAIWPGRPPVGSERRPDGRRTNSRSTGRTSGSRRQEPAGEADG